MFEVGASGLFLFHSDPPTLSLTPAVPGAGKTTITDFIRHKIPYTNLYRLNGTSDSSPTGKEKSKEMYKDLVDYIDANK